MDRGCAQFVFLFLDGIGLAPPHPANPVATAASLPFLRQLLGVPYLAPFTVQAPGCLLKPIDAQLGIAGLPQSATGQTALYTGRNASAFMGRHLTGFANGSLRILIEESGIFKQILALGGLVTHANLYLPEYFQAIEQRRKRYSVGTLLALTADVPFRMLADYEQGKAIYWDITGYFLQKQAIATPTLTPQAAGQRLANLSQHHHLTLFECYLPDYAGHAQDRHQAEQVLATVDAFLEGVVTHLPPQVTLVVSSDHGNIEDLSTKKHTLNPVPLLAIGPHALAFADVEDITGITPKIVDLFLNTKLACEV